jgi:hypothetical protein
MYFLGILDYLFSDAMIGEGITVFIVSDALESEKLHEGTKQSIRALKKEI